MTAEEDAGLQHYLSLCQSGEDLARWVCAGGRECPEWWVVMLRRAAWLLLRKARSARYDRTWWGKSGVDFLMRVPARARARKRKKGEAEFDAED